MQVKDISKVYSTDTDVPLRIWIDRKGEEPELLHITAEQIRGEEVNPTPIPRKVLNMVVTEIKATSNGFSVYCMED